MPDISQENKVAVVVPVYQSNPTEQELLHYYHNLSILKGFPILVVAPLDLNIDIYCKTPGIRSEFFAPDYFKNIAGYNKLMLSTEFYERFANYEYILICQLDALYLTTVY